MFSYGSHLNELLLNGGSKYFLHVDNQTAPAIHGTYGATQNCFDTLKIALCRRKHCTLHMDVSKPRKTEKAYLQLITRNML